MSRLSRRFPSTSSTSQTPSILNRNPCLPPVGQEQDSSALRFAQLLKEKEEGSKANNTATSSTITSLPGSTSAAGRLKLDSDANKSSRLMGPLTSVKEDEPIENVPPPTGLPSSEYPPDVKTQQAVLEAILRQAHSVRSPRRLSSEVLLRESLPSAKKSTRKDSADNVEAAPSTQRPPSTSASTKPRGVERLWSDSSDIPATSFPTPSSAAPPTAKRQLSLDAFAESLVKPSTASSKRDRKNGASSGAGGRGVVLESLNINEVRAMSGLLSSYVQRTSASKSRTTPTGGGKEGRRTPDGRLLVSGTSRTRYMHCRNIPEIFSKFSTVEKNKCFIYYKNMHVICDVCLSVLQSGRGPVLSRLGSGGAGGRVSPRLAPMKHKKKATKRCFLCGKKTGLATSYQCRWGEESSLCVHEQQIVII